MHPIHPFKVSFTRSIRYDFFAYFILEESVDGKRFEHSERTHFIHFARPPILESKTQKIKNTFKYLSL